MGKKSETPEYKEAKKELLLYVEYLKRRDVTRTEIGNVIMLKHPERFASFVSNLEKGKGGGYVMNSVSIVEMVSRIEAVPVFKMIIDEETHVDEKKKKRNH